MGTCLCLVFYQLEKFQLYAHVIVLGVGDNLKLFEKEFQEKKKKKKLWRVFGCEFWGPQGVY